MKIAAFDIGGTALKMGVVLPHGEIILTKSAEISGSDGDQTLAEMKLFLAENTDVTGIAVSAPGYVNPKTGLITMGGAIRRFDNFNLKEWLEAETGIPVAIENDANCALLAEKWLGKGQNLDDFLCLTIGTGIGGGIFSNGALVRGGRFRAGEFGYMFSERPGAFRPGKYTLNETTTMLVLRRQYAELTGRPLEEITGEEIFAKYDGHDAVSERLITEFYTGICTGLYNLIYLFDPTHIFIGGGITSRPTFITELKHHMESFGLRDTIIETATHKNQAGLLGAVYHFLQEENRHE
ncbi:beta-glucoside kinase [Listeria monocytogenes]|nr:beta-glucoside kinase [Listeria monocytogenes]